MLLHKGRGKKLEKLGQEKNFGALEIISDQFPFDFLSTTGRDDVEVPGHICFIY